MSNATPPPSHRCSCVADAVLQVAQLCPCSETEGPGRRFVVWTQGCQRRCSGCCNPEMWPRRGGRTVPVAQLVQQVLAAHAEHRLEGLTLLGGEPAQQAGACAQLTRQVRARGLSVMLFSGYTLGELRRGDDPAWPELLAQVDLLVDGPYRAAQPETRRRWIGSANQQLHRLSSRYRADDPRFTAANGLELRLSSDGELQVIGWPGAAERVLS